MCLLLDTILDIIRLKMTIVLLLYTILNYKIYNNNLYIE